MSDFADRGLTVTRLESLDPETIGLLEGYGREALGESALDNWLLPVVARFGMLFIAEAGGETVGAAEVLRCKGPEDVYLEGFYIRPVFQGRGFGAALLDQVLDACTAEGVMRMQATVSPGNESGRRLYRRAGFREVAALPDFYGKGRDRMLLELDLTSRLAAGYGTDPRD
ncbi:MAG: GNAT family N-acetyltransferase [Pseudomonadota bacterium]